ncbi:hypothetical protein [Minwuia sp.]|uniref:tetratricopeptide repeat protein n=1 Tax=Minwuia sp. TaxID=2493630 RepID=UPI003A8D80EA
MPVRVEQDQDHAAGVARLTAVGAAGLDPDTLEIRITSSQNGADRHLDPSRAGADAWVPAERWFRGASAAEAGSGFSVELGPAATWHLKPFQPYAVTFRDGTGKTVEDRMIWIDMRLPSNPPPPSEDAGVASAAPVEETPVDPAPEPDPLAAFAEMEEEQPEAQAEPVTDPDPPVSDEEKSRGSSVLWWILGVLLLIAAIGAAVWFFLLNAPDEPVAEDPPPVAETPAGDPAPDVVEVPLTLEGARAFLLEQKPAPDRALDEADRFTAGDQHQAAFLLTKYAAQKGDGQAQFRMAQYYDPATHDPATGVIPEADPRVAADWYEQSAKLGTVEAMARLGEMLKQGLVDRPDAPEQAVFWLRKAAEAGNEKAKELLE